MFKLLVTNSNECEISGEWEAGAPLVQLPLSEQIVVLHRCDIKLFDELISNLFLHSSINFYRLDHSVHTMRLWALQEAKQIAHTWDLDVFFLLVKGDVVNCIQELQQLKVFSNAIKNV